MKTIKILSISRLRTYTDGDGISTLVGCMGCPLRCAYCLNPYSWDGSLKSQSFTIDELYEKVKIDNLYFLSTGGGIVFGGGEPLLYSKFIKEFIEKYKITGWKFGIETSLSVKKENLMEIIDYIDFFIVDTKDMNKQRYELYTLGDYDLFIDNLKFLKDNFDADKIRLRVPEIPKLNKSNDIAENYEILKRMGFLHIENFRYIEPETAKKLSEVAIKRKKEFDELIKINENIE